MRWPFDAVLLFQKKQCGQKIMRWYYTVEKHAVALYADKQCGEE